MELRRHPGVLSTSREYGARHGVLASIAGLTLGWAVCLGQVDDPSSAASTTPVQAVLFAAREALDAAGAVEEEGRFAEAGRLYERDALLAGATVEGITASEKAASAYQRGALLDDARRCVQRALDLRDEAVAEYRTRPGVMQYYKTRWELDGHWRRAKLLGQLAEIERAADEPKSAADIDATLHSRFPAMPEGRTAALRTAEQMAADGRHKEAVQLVAAGMDYLGDHAPPTVKAVLADNAAYLASTKTPRSPAAMTRIVGVLAECDPQSRPSEASVSDVARQWVEAEVLAHQGQIAAACDRWHAIAAATDWPLLSCAARLARAQWLLNAGRPSLAEVEYGLVWDETATGESVGLGLRWIVARDLGVSCQRRGEWERAYGWLRRSSDLAPVQLRPRIDFLAAECLEFQGKAEEAIAAYESVADSPHDSAGRDGAAYASQRVGAHEKIVRRLAEPRHVVYLGEDRETAGEWPLRYGQEAFFLGGMNWPGNRGGGSLARELEVRGGSRTWLTPDDGVIVPAMMIDPLDGLRKHSNWGDFGEQTPLGQGPGIEDTIRIPPGLHRLSLYFANDLRYYEPNREYTIYLRLRQRGYSACAVRHFAGGVYEQFAVLGPADIIIDIDRNLSLNTILSGIFLDPLYVAEPGEGSPIADSAALWEACRGARELLAASPVSTVEAAAAFKAWQAARLLNTDPSLTEAHLQRAVEAVEVAERPEWLKELAERHFAEGLWQTGQQAAQLRLEESRGSKPEEAAQTALWAAHLCAARVDSGGGRAKSGAEGVPGKAPLLPAGERFFDTYLDLMGAREASGARGRAYAAAARAELAAGNHYYAMQAARRLESMGEFDALTGEEVAELAHGSARSGDDLRLLESRLDLAASPEQAAPVLSQMMEEQYALDDIEGMRSTVTSARDLGLQGGDLAVVLYKLAHTLADRRLDRPGADELFLEIIAEAPGTREAERAEGYLER